MAAKKTGRAGGIPPPRLKTEAPARQAADESAGVEISGQNTLGEDKKVTPSYGFRAQTQVEGVTVIGEAVRRIPSESAEFVIEVTSAATTAAQALRENQAKTMQVTQAISQLGAQSADIQTISLKVQSLYAPVLQSLPAYSGFSSMGQGGFSAHAAAAAMQPEVQFGSYVARNMLRVVVREPARTGDIADMAVRAGATLVGGFRFRATDEAGAQRAALEAAAKDARIKAEALASASGKQLGDPIGISEDIVASNGAFSALRAMMSPAFGPAAPDVIGELEYYARVSANFRFA
jgi:uncharacterized protein YggE